MHDCVAKPADEPIDSSVLEDLGRLQQEGAPDLVTTVIQLYLQETRSLIGALRQAEAIGDLPAAGRIAHSIKSSSGNVGAIPLSKLCAEIEQAARTQWPTSLAQFVEAVETEFLRVEAALMAFTAADAGIDAPANALPYSRQA
jgi:HPt (histidine-containing phosphotransfer) domain-containing protein